MPCSTSLIVSLLLLVIGGCTGRTPSSTFDGSYSTTTALRVPPGLGPNSYKGYPDDRVIQFDVKGSSCAFGLLIPPRKAAKQAQQIFAPGIVQVNDSLGIDEAEIPNREWQHYQLQQEQAGIPAAAILPHASALPVPDYYSDPFYRYYPVVGISYEQAVAFCQWRSQVVTANYNQQGALPIDSLSPKYVRFTFRLPTEAEWMLAARDEWSQLSKSSCSELPVTIPPKAAAYLKKRSGSAVDVAQISADIQRYNAQKPVRSWINYQQQEPYFLQLITPGYVYQSPSNHYKIFQLLGNVAELVQEPGITKGGSYLEPLTACAPEARGTYSGPAPHVGFRCVCVVSYPNRK